jgi:hypothetical protein
MSWIKKIGHALLLLFVIITILNIYSIFNYTPIYKISNQKEFRNNDYAKPPQRPIYIVDKLVSNIGLPKGNPLWYNTMYNGGTLTHMTD